MCFQREQPIYSAKAHVFQIDPATKRNWLPASKHAVTVSFFYDAGRSVYRIISVGGTKVGVGLCVRPPRFRLALVCDWFQDAFVPVLRERSEVSLFESEVEGRWAESFSALYFLPLDNF